MDIVKVYHTIGVAPEPVVRRLINGSIVEKYLLKFINDGTYHQLSEMVRQGQYSQAAQAAHTLKGLALNLELIPLAKESAALLEELRLPDPVPEKIDDAFEKLSETYRTVIGKLQACQ